MHRRTFFRSLAVTAGTGAALGALTPRALADLPPARIKRINIYEPPNLNSIFNQSNMVVTVETDAGFIGVGEGGTRDTLEQCAGRLIGQDPFRTERLWQDMYRSFFYPPGREKIHALGAFDLALWDIKGKALNVPVYELLGGMNRNHLECYATSGGGGGGSLRERAAAAMAAGYRAFRMDAASVRGGNTYNVRERVRQLARDCEQARLGVGENGDWCIDFHTRLDLNEALRACKLIEEYEPYFVEDPVRSEAFLQDIPRLRGQTSVPIAAGEQWGARWDFHRLLEGHDIDWMRATLPNVGGITEMLKIMALCETHDIGIAPHFTGPIATAALVHVLGPFPGPIIVEYNYGSREIDYLPEYTTFRNGKLWPNGRPGLGVRLNIQRLKLIAELTQPGPNRQTYYRPDGSQTNW